MKALTIRQPWLWAITDLDKRIENRTWCPPDSLIGERIGLHAGLKLDVIGASAIEFLSGIVPPHAEALPRGVIVATARLVGWIDWNGDGVVDSPCMGHLVDDKWFFGPVGWILDEVEKIEPLPCRGALGLWEIPEGGMWEVPASLEIER